MTKKSYRDAIREAIASEMRRDHRVIVMGEDNAGGAGAPGEKDAWGGVLGVTKGLQPEFGADRVLDTPITESAFIGAAAGAAATGLRPIAELMFVDFMGVCFDQIFNQAAKFRYMFGGKAVTPLVIRTMYGAGFRAASQHSQCLYPLFTHIPGLKVVLPSSPYDAKGLMIQAIRDDDPVIFFEHKLMYDEAAEVPDESYTIPFGEANVTREGRDATIVAFGRMVNPANQAADEAQAPGSRRNGYRSADHVAARHRNDTRQRRRNGTAGGRRRIPSEVLDGFRHRSVGRRGGLQRSQGADQDRNGAAHTRAFLAGVEDIYVPTAAKIRDAVLAVTKGRT